MRRLIRRFKFHIERWIQYGVLHQLLFIAAIIGLVAGTAGLAALVLTGEFSGPGEAVWWAFLRLTDPGYLGDDRGTVLRGVSTVVTVLGYVLFLGSLIAIMTQWLGRTIQRLESGLTPVSARGHLLILGWTNRTPAVLLELMASEGRVRRFLRGRGVRRLRVAVLAEQIDPALLVELREYLGSHWARRRIILRSGSALRPEDLRRVDAARAGVIIIPGADHVPGGPEATDTAAVKALMGVAALAEDSQDGEGPPEYPPVVTEMYDVEKVPNARTAYPGSVDVIPSDLLIGRLLAQNIRNPGLSAVFSELIGTSGGNEVYIRVHPDLAGLSFGELAPLFDRAVPLGVVRRGEEESGERVLLNPPLDMEVRAGDRLVVMARSYEEAAPRGNAAATSGAHPASADLPAPGARAGLRPACRILVLGWSRKLRTVIRELGGHSDEFSRIDIVSRVPAAERAVAAPSIEVRHIEGDYTRLGFLEQLEPGTYDNVVLPAGDSPDSEEESDARTLLGLVLLRSLLAVREKAGRPDVLVELMDPDNAGLLGRESEEVIISPLILSHLLAHTAVRSEFHGVFSELLGPDGPEVVFRLPQGYLFNSRVGRDPAPESGAGVVRTSDLRAAVAAHNEILLGVQFRSSSGSSAAGVYLNPPAGEEIDMAAVQALVVMGGSGFSDGQEYGSQ